MNCKKPNLSGPLYKHLGHFSNKECVDRGHNDSGKIQIQYSGSIPSVEIESGSESEDDGEDSKENGNGKMKNEESIDSKHKNMMMSSSMNSSRKKRMMEE